MTLTPIAERLAVELSLPDFTAGIRTPNLRHARLTAAVSLEIKKCMNVSIETQ